MNNLLRDQLDQSRSANQRLTDDLQRLNNELQHVREEFTKKTRDWKEEERVSNSFYSNKTKKEQSSISPLSGKSSYKLYHSI